MKKLLCVIGCLSVLISTGAMGQTELAKRFGAALLSCGNLSHNTTPDGWQAALVRGGAPGSADCYVWIPYPWKATYVGEAGNFFWDGTQGLTGATFLSGVANIQDCSPRGYAQWYMNGAAQGCPNVVLQSYEEFMSNIAGLQVPTSRFSYSCVKNGVPIISGVTAYVPAPTTGLCLPTSMGISQPVAEIGPATCVPAQLLASHKCRSPQGQLCDRPAASAWCKANGYPLGGYCDSFEQVKCVQ